MFIYIKTNKQFLKKERDGVFISHRHSRRFYSISNYLRLIRRRGDCYFVGGVTHETVWVNRGRQREMGIMVGMKD